MNLMHFDFKLNTGGEKGILRDKRENLSGTRPEMPKLQVETMPVGDGPTIAVGVETRDANAKEESLGKQVIEGIEAEGARTTITIPAGGIGNERAIEIISERWYSTELQTVVMTKHSDPRFGETVYRLTNISRSDPDASLFQVPSDYRIKDVPTSGMPPMPMRIRPNEQ
jgi:hypothetical protein